MTLGGTGSESAGGDGVQVGLKTKVKLFFWREKKKRMDAKRGEDLAILSPIDRSTHFLCYQWMSRY